MRVNFPSDCKKASCILTVLFILIMPSFSYAYPACTVEKCEEYNGKACRNKQTGAPGTYSQCTLAERIKHLCYCKCGGPSKLVQPVKCLDR